MGRAKGITKVIQEAPRRGHQSAQSTVVTPASSDTLVASTTPAIVIQVPDLLPPAPEPQKLYTRIAGRINTVKSPIPKVLPVAYRVQTHTRTGMPLLVQGFADGDPTIKEGYTVDTLEAHGEDGPVAYLQMAYIDSRKLQKFFPTPVHYAVRELGKHSTLLPYINVDEKLWKDSDYLGALAASDSWRVRSEELQARETYDTATLKQTWAARRKELTKDNQAEYDRLLTRLDKPIVDYIRTYAPGDDDLYINGYRRGELTNSRDYQHKGVGLEMYRQGALWLAQRGLVLHASGIQRPGAVGAWASMERAGVVGHYHDGKYDRSFIDVSKIDAIAP